MSLAIKRNKIKYYLLALFIVGLMLFNHFAPRLIIQTHSGVLTWLRPPDLENRLNIKDFTLNYYPFHIKTNDGFNLACYLVHSEKDFQKGTIILVHGIRAYKEHFLPLASYLAKNGYNSVLIDLRAHGKSEGKYCSFGYHEKHDLKIVVDTLLSFGQISHKIGVWGQSLGGAVALQALENDRRLQFGVVESTFSNFRTIVDDYFHYHSNISIPILTNFLISRAEFIGKFDADEIKPSESAKNIIQPVIMVHGKKDKRINISYGKENYKNLNSKQKKFIEYPNANHLNIWKQDRLYFKKYLHLLNLLNSNLQEIQIKARNIPFDSP